MIDSEHGGVRVRGFVLGPFATNSYIVQAGSHAWVVDPSYEPAALIRAAAELTVDAIVLTHAHPDHIAGVAEARGALGPAPILIHEAERDWPGDPERNLSARMGEPVIAPAPDAVLRDGDRLTLGESEWKVLHTPGHSPGGISLHCPVAGLVIVGDALFAGSIGRTDFPGGDFETLAASIRRKLYTLPDGTVVYAGHGPATTIGRERRMNPFVRP